MQQIKLNIDNISSCLCTFYNNGRADVMVIDSFQTKEEFRNQGYGTMLMAKAILLAEKHNVGAIELVTDNEIAEKLYKKMGFDKTDKVQYRIIL